MNNNIQMAKQKRIIESKKYAKTKNGYCLSFEYINKDEKLKWICENNHEWEASYHNTVYKKSWCNICAKSELSKKYRNPEGLNIAQNYARSRGGLCLSTEYLNANQKLLWKCNNTQHNSWESSSSQAIRNNTWCPQCGYEKLSEHKKNKNGLKIAKEHAKYKKGECLSNEYVSAITRMKWKCENNHEWESPFASVVHTDTWCPQCSVYYRKEHIMRYLLEYLLDSKFPKSKPKWNINPETKRLLEFDGYSKDLGIAFEFQGLHHYQAGVFYKDEKDLAYIQYKDSVKKQNCINNNVKLVIIDDNFKLSQQQELLSYVLHTLDNLNIFISKPINTIRISEIFAMTTNIQEEYLEKAQQHAESKGGKCLSSAYLSSNDKLKWKCSNSEHKAWKAPYYEVVISGTWCPRCIGRYSKEEQLLRAKEYAISKGGHCLSEEYTNSESKLIWKCHNPGHALWEATFTQVFKGGEGGTWCPQCVGRFSKEEQLSKAKEYAILKGGECLSTEYLSVKDKLIWKCNNAHHDFWESDYEHVVNRNRWCPECAKIHLNKKNKNPNGLTIAQDFAQSKGGKCLSSEYINNQIKMKWVCSHNHEWEANFSNIVTCGKWCPECAIEKRKISKRNKNGLELAQKYAISKGGNCLSKEYIKSSAKLEWKCDNTDHKSWFSNYNNTVQKKRWCPQCAIERSKKL